jgi:hypothetical protein
MGVTRSQIFMPRSYRPHPTGATQSHGPFRPPPRLSCLTGFSPDLGGPRMPRGTGGPPVSSIRLPVKNKEAIARRPVSLSRKPRPALFTLRRLQ